MDARLYVKPARPGLRVVDPDSGLALPEEGAEIRTTTYWRRRIRCGDVEVLEGPPTTPAPAATGKKRSGRASSAEEKS